MGARDSKEVPGPGTPLPLHSLEPYAGWTSSAFVGKECPWLPQILSLVWETMGEGRRRGISLQSRPQVQGRVLPEWKHRTSELVQDF